MKSPLLEKLIQRYESAPKEFQATKYWQKNKQPILDALQYMDLNELRSGKYPVGNFGFNETVFKGVSFKNRIKSIAYLAWKLFFRKQHYLPYKIDLADIREMSFRHCKLYGALTNAKDIASIEVSKFGNPADIFQMESKWYTIQFLGFYIRYCFAHKHIRFNGNEIIVELGSGSGHQVEILKKLYPGLTILCFDLPAQIFICESYLSESLGKNKIVSSSETMDWTDLSRIEKGKVHFFGNWQFPVIENFSFDVFWNAASFGEMEPDVVKNYLRFVKSNCRFIYLLQARHGKEAGSVDMPITFKDYNDWLNEYKLLEDENAFRAHMRLKESGGYFHAIWELK